MQRTRTANPAGRLAELFHPQNAMGHIAELFHPQNAGLLQQLLAQLRANGAGGVPHPGPSPHGFGPGGSVIGDNTNPTPNGGGPMIPLQPGPVSPQALGLGANHLSPSSLNFGGEHPLAQMLRGAGGSDSAAAALWMQRHPGAMGTGRFIPSWVTPYLPGANRAPQAPSPQAY